MPKNSNYPGISLITFVLGEDPERYLDQDPRNSQRSAIKQGF
jgi:hypothetical protein